MTLPHRARVMFLMTVSAAFSPDSIAGTLDRGLVFGVPIDESDTFLQVICDDASVMIDRADLVAMLELYREAIEGRWRLSGARTSLVEVPVLISREACAWPGERVEDNKYEVGAVSANLTVELILILDLTRENCRGIDTLENREKLLRSLRRFYRRWDWTGPRRQALASPRSLLSIAKKLMDRIQGCPLT